MLSKKRVSWVFVSALVAALGQGDFVFSLPLAASELPAPLAQRPPAGICLPVTYDRCRDGDTVVVRVSGAFAWAIRLQGTWCPERNTPTGKKATAFAEQILQKAKPGSLWLFVPLPRGENLLKSLSFDRLVGYLFVSDGTTLNELLVAAKLASTTKGGKLGE